MGTQEATQTQTHTPTPWRVEPSYENIPGGGELLAIGASYQWPEGEAAFVALAFTPRFGVGPYAANRKADAAFIVTAANHHDALIAVCRDLLAWGNGGPELKHLESILATMRSLLQSATGAPEDAT